MIQWNNALPDEPNAPPCAVIDLHTLLDIQPTIWELRNAVTIAESQGRPDIVELLKYGIGVAIRDGRPFICRRLGLPPEHDQLLRNIITAAAGIWVQS